MAHSNRQKLRDARGGKTRHQFNKTRAPKYANNGADRIKELEVWLLKKNEKGATNSKVVKVKRIPMIKPILKRRRNALKRLLPLWTDTKKGVELTAKQLYTNNQILILKGRC